MSEQEIKDLQNKIEIVTDLLANKFGKIKADEKVRLEKKLKMLQSIK